MDGGRRLDQARAVTWTWVFAANLIVPLPLGLGITAGSEWARLGMAAALIGTWAIGIAAAAVPGRLGRALVDGGIHLALFQFGPVPQIGAGIVGVLTWEVAAPRVGLTGPGPVAAAVGGFVMTGVTAQLLVLTALFLGGGHRLVFGPVAGGTPSGSARQP